MRSLKQLHDDLEFVKECRTLFDVIQQAALSQLRRYEEMLRPFQPLARMVQERFFPLLPTSAASHLFLRGDRRDNLLIVLSADQGLVGPLYHEVIRSAESLATEGSRWIVVGERGSRLLTDRGVVSQLIAVPSDEAVSSTMEQLAQQVMRQLLRGQLGEVWLIFPRFVSMTAQVATTQRLIPPPVSFAKGEARPSGPRAADGGETGGGMIPPDVKLGSAQDEVIVEPSVGRVAEELVFLWVWAHLEEAFWSSRLAELAARSLHLEEAREELVKLGKQARLEFFKAVHERIDVMVRQTASVKRWRPSTEAQDAIPSGVEGWR